MRTFGISKGQMQRAVVKFKEPPQKQPLTVCFHYPGNFLTHRYVLDIVCVTGEELMTMINDHGCYDDDADGGGVDATCWT